MSDLVEILSDPDTKAQFASMPEDKQAAFLWRMSWLGRAHEHQILPAGDWWTIWLMLAGRGAGRLGQPLGS